MKRAKVAPSAPETGQIVAKEAARRLGLTHQAIGQWTKRPGAPVRIEGARVYVQWPAFARWREEELCRQRVEEATAGMRRQLDASQSGDPMQRKLRADARKAEIDVEMLERSLVTVEEAAAVTERLLTDLRAVLAPFPRVAAPKLLGAKTLAETEQRLHAEIVRVMERLSAPDLGAPAAAPGEAAA